jgi:ABC-type transporter Mla MlaB component
MGGEHEKDTLANDHLGGPMLRISAPEPVDNSATLRVEGRLVGAWIGELHDACERVLRRGQQLTLDLADISMIDRPGIQLLKALAERGVRLARCSPFQEVQLRTVELEQAANANER